MKPKNPNAAVRNVKFYEQRGRMLPILRKGGLTKEILYDGNLETLKKFYAEHEATLDEKEKDYMAARIAAAEKIQELKQKAEDRIAEGKLPPTPKLDEKDGFVGFSGLRGDGKQTSGNGCWSYSLAIQFKARGVNIAQEDIRGWRPDQSLNTLTEQQKSEPGYQGYGHGALLAARPAQAGIHKAQGGVRKYHSARSRKRGHRRKRQENRRAVCHGERERRLEHQRPRCEPRQQIRLFQRGADGERGLRAKPHDGHGGARAEV